MTIFCGDGGGKDRERGVIAGAVSGVLPLDDRGMTGSRGGTGEGSRGGGSGHSRAGITGGIPRDAMAGEES